ncbi:CBS domain-containing protein [Methanococcus aeolicus]|uniref:CBS domain containing protein n=1 Tax=Methanococcus aeolicus (strain ATCC BAA-1280 / DSM 17508 / OCM 812 / Nankai-3) TaxID=419665 RepID=A6UUP2_META3|nr:CBS domain-containing protein [Methanococcus aeolicus]ABR56214.1 CBS domain containing protein [Methanococcus aeolicus Nankai-3]UXM84225.1 CBS domain-containing protein [Methanococcus aeolicus]
MKITKIIEGNNAIMIYPSTTIRDALQIMDESDIRRIAVVDAGSNRVEGVLSSVDIVDFMGGGSKYNLVKSKHNRNLYAAINEPVKSIMASNPICVKETARLKDVLNTFSEKHIGGAPIVDKDNKLISMITERIILKSLKEDIGEKETVEDYMTKNPVVASGGERIKDVARTMVRNEFRRLPVVSHGKLIGKITSKDFIEFLGSDMVFEKLKTGNIRELTNMRVEDIINGKKNPTISNDAPLREAVEIMEKENTWALPVMDGSKLVGIITEKDILAYFKE